MADYVFRNEDRADRLDADKATIADKKVKFYCPNPKCNARLTIRDVGGDAHFGALPTYPHIEGCRFRTSGGNYHKYEEKSFNLENMIDNLFKYSTTTSSSSSQVSSANISNNEKTVGPIRTLKMLYAMCQSKEIGEKYNDFPIEGILVDDRSQHLYSKGVWGKRLVKCVSVRYDNEAKEILAKLCDEDGKKVFDFVLKFDDEKLYKENRDRIYGNSPTGNFQNVNLVVAGEWSKYNSKFNHFITKILSTRQLLILD